MARIFNNTVDALTGANRVIRKQARTIRDQSGKISDLEDEVTNLTPEPVPASTVMRRRSNAMRAAEQDARAAQHDAYRMAGNRKATVYEATRLAQWHYDAGNFARAAIIMTNLRDAFVFAAFDVETHDWDTPPPKENHVNDAVFASRSRP
jgi:hypothetical protein